MSLSPEEITAWREADRVMDDLLDLPPTERVAALARLDLAENVRQCVEKLLKASDSESLLDGPVPALPDAVEGDLSGQVFGRWTLAEQIGRGGMAVVYRATREESGFSQTAAVKLMPRGMTGHERFAREQQVLARLEHPNIARFLDGGVAPDGTPWLAMELIDGVPIDEACDELSTRERVHLLIPIIEAVAYAHQQLIIHRDLKPGNIMVDREGRPRLLDFGIAKLLSEEQEASTTRILTPGYAAPEQFAGGAVSTATDVFGLGAVLQSVLSGTQAESDEASLAHGDLRNVIAKALREEPQERYGTARELCEDLERWFDDRPVAATPDSRRYRLRKFVGRHRALVSSFAAVTLVVAAAVTAVFWQARETAEQARMVAAQNDVLRGILRSPMAVAKGRQARVVDVLADASQELEEKLPEPSLERAQLYETMARTLEQLNDAERSVPLWQRAIADFDSLGNNVSARNAVNQRLGLAIALIDAGRHDEALEILDDAESVATRLEPDDPLLVMIAARRWVIARRSDPGWSRELWQEAMERAKSARWRTEEERLRFEILRTQGLIDNGRYADAIDAARGLLADCREALGERHSHTLDAYTSLATALSQAGRYEEAERVAAEGEAIAAEWLGENDGFVFAVRMSRAASIQKQGRFDESTALLRQLVQMAEEMQGLTAMDRLLPRLNLSNSLQEAGNFDEAEPELLAALEAVQDLLGDQHVVTLVTYSNLAELRIFDGRPREALEPAVVGHEGLTETLGAEHPATLFARCTRAGAMVNAGQPEQALELLADLEEALATARGADDPNVFNARIWRGQALLDLDRVAEARPLLEEGHQWRLANLGAEHLRTQRAAALLARASARR